MAKKCCKSDPPCKGCPKLKKKKKHGTCDALPPSALSAWPIFTIGPLS